MTDLSFTPKIWAPTKKKGQYMGQESPKEAGFEHASTAA